MITFKDIKPGNIINHILYPKRKEMICRVSEDEFVLFLLRTGNIERWKLCDKTRLKWFDYYEVFYRVDF